MIDQLTIYLMMYQWVFWLLVAWSAVWKGLALWRAARNKHTVWYICLLVINTLGILEILYLSIWGKKKQPVA